MLLWLGMLELVMMRSTCQTSRHLGAKPWNLQLTNMGIPTAAVGVSAISLLHWKYAKFFPFGIPPQKANHPD